MHSQTTAAETLDLLWQNYQRLAEITDEDELPPDVVFEMSTEQFRAITLANWLAKQGFIVSAWFLWEYFARAVIHSIPTQVPQKTPQQSFPNWVQQALNLNDVDFVDYEWFSNANHLRNLIVHEGARVVSKRAESKFEKAQLAFNDLHTFKDGYIYLSHHHVTTVKLEIEQFIRRYSV